MLRTDRVVIVGAGLGGLYAALSLAPHPVLVISPEALGEGASSAWAQGGVAAAMAAHDSPESHASDTLAAGAGTVDAGVANMVTQAARDHILDLAARGTPFDRDADGQFQLNHEAAHSTARVVRVKGDQAGKKIMETLIATVRATPSVQVMEGVVAQALDVEDGRVTGIWLARAAGGSQSVRLHAPAVLLAGGGSGGLYALTTNPPRIRGQVMGLAARAGAMMADMEFIQFHPTAMDLGLDPAPLATEALRGAGARLVNAQGVYFMDGQHPQADLAPRDIVARAVFAQTQRGLRPMLDMRAAAAGADLAARFPAVHDACMRAGLDPAQVPVPVAAAAHYHMGGVATDRMGRSSLPGLWVCGEAASTGLHGANRLASNGVLEALVFARAAAADIALTLTGPADTPVVALDFPAGGVALDADGVMQLRRTMSAHVGVRRSAQGLAQALTVLNDLETTYADSPDFSNMCATATLIAASAYARRESRGAHWRDDFPQSDAAQAMRSFMTLTQAHQVRATAMTEHS
ncbi:L-aspartate oxidase [Roseinatronobacter alkalisoli]|uniref:L-aspartate oxidase n=1 Tax=Roseinatronobacter alkalisoli TaxID=3028235 RepID=A0ABT5T6M0_9RHOB|nr:L-aspartate oxidase [Roseinatronobacter sp. HJB301]MDD7970767.1 L-aspartate oxidase [Roseinatronobacter sp. HJB301]